MITPKSNVHEKSLSTVARQHIDYRTLVRRSRFEQIEAELVKLKGRLAAVEGKNQAKGVQLSKSVGTEVNVQKQQNEGKSDRLNQALVNIEDDLHRILYILLHQYEMAHRKRHRHTKHSTPLTIKSTESRNSKNGDKQIEQSKLSRAISQPNLFSQTNELTAQGQTVTKYLRSQSSEHRKSLSKKANEAEVVHCHYHISKPDVHWILGTSTKPSFSLMARKQLQLAKLKQHGPLCMKSTPNLAIECAPEERALMISRIQTMINELQFEYDRWYRKLQFQQSVDDHSREDTAEISHLSGHLIHIMDQLVELHQLNKSFLC